MVITKRQPGTVWPGLRCCGGPSSLCHWRLAVRSLHSECPTSIADTAILLTNTPGGFPGGLDSKESAFNVRDLGSIPGSGRSHGEWNGYPLQYSCLENLMDRGYSSWGHKELDTNERLTTFLISKNSGRFDRKYRVNKYGSCHLRGWWYRKGESHAYHKEVSQIARLPGKDILLLSVQYPFSLLCKPYHSFPLRNHLFLLMWKCPTIPSFIHPHHLQERV